MGEHECCFDDEVDLAVAGGDAGALVAAVSEGGRPRGGRGLQRAEQVFAGGGQVVGRSALDIGIPERKSAGGGEGLDVAAVFVSLAGVPQVDLIAFHAGGLLAVTVGGEGFPSRIT